jgi:hypothetical protein
MKATAAPKERPKDFRGPSVRAILEGHKTQFREVVKLPDLQPWQLVANVQGWHFIECSHSVENCNDFIAGFLDKRGAIHCIKCPSGKPADPSFSRPADRLWVQEAFCIESSREVAYEPPFDDGRPIRHHNDEHWGPWWEQPHYRATDPTPELEIGTGDPGVKWRSSIFMPRWASRIDLEITAVRVERLQSISEADARAEGITLYNGRWWDGSWIVGGKWDTPVQAFCALFESINGPGSWAANPWVWVVEFQRVQP